MANTPFQPPPGMVTNETVFAAPGRWWRGSWVRFWQGSWQVKGGFERLSLTNLGGVCRSVFGWQNKAEEVNIAFGLHNGLKTWKNGALSTITPAFNYPPATLANNPLTTVNGTPNVTVAQPGHPYLVGQNVTISGSATPVNGIAPNGTWAITATTANTWTFVAGANATASGAGGGAAVLVQNQIAFIVGQTDGTGGAGYGTGAFGLGTYGSPSTADYFPLTWSLSSWGGGLMANPRGRGIFYWDGVSAAAVGLGTAAPSRVTYMLVTPQRQVIALGCNEEISGAFNPLGIRWSDIEDYTAWTTLPSNNAGEHILESGGRIVCGRMVGDYMLVWTSVSLFLGTFIGDPGQTWKFERVGSNCGAIGPNVPVVRGQNAMWISPDRQFWTYSLGGAPQLADSAIRDSFSDNISQGQYDKIVGSSVSAFGELTWFYPDARDGLENSRALSVAADGWSSDLIARSAFIDSGPHPNPIGVSPDGWAYWHEKGQSADGAVLQGFIESTDVYLNDATGGIMVNGVWPDLKQQVGVFKLSLYGREFPQDTDRVHGPWSISPGQSFRTFRVAAKIMRVRWDFASAPAYARGGKPEFDVQTIGGR